MNGCELSCICMQNLLIFIICIKYLKTHIIIRIYEMSRIKKKKMLATMAMATMLCNEKGGTILLATQQRCQNAPFKMKYTKC